VLARIKLSSFLGTGPRLILIVYSLLKTLIHVFSIVCFKVFDGNADGFLTKDEIIVMCQTLLEIRNDNSLDKVMLLY